MIQWTVEWIHPDGLSEIGSCFDNESISTAYAARIRTRNPKTIFQRSSRKRQKQRKSIPLQSDNSAMEAAEVDGQAEFAEFDNTEAQTQKGHPNILLPPGIEAAEAQTSLPVDIPSVADIVDLPESLTVSSGVETSVDPIQSTKRSADPDLALEVIPSSSVFNEPADPPADDPDRSEDNEEPVTPKATSDPSQYIYLYAPRLPSSRPVLIPLSFDATLSDCLRDRRVLEFPTLYVLHEAPDMLEGKYITEEVFLRQMEEQGYREKIEAKLTGYEEGQISEDTNAEDNNVDERKLEEVLKQDLRSFQLSIS